MQVFVSQKFRFRAKTNNVDEAVTAEANDINDMENDLKEELNTKSYKDTMNIDIENNNAL